MPCTIIEVTRPGIATVGGGGKHRAYQMAHDLTHLVGQERLSRLNVPDWPDHALGISWRQMEKYLAYPRDKALMATLLIVGQ